MLKMQRLSTRFLKTTSCGHLYGTKKLTPGGHGILVRSHSVTTFSATQKLVPDGKVTQKIFAPYDIYKGKAALSSKPILPTFRKTDLGGLAVDRRGCVMLTFLPASGERKYDSEKKQMFALSATEIGSLINMGPQDSCEFLHDPSMKSSNAGQVRKSLSIKAHADGSGYFFSLNVVNNVMKTNDRMVVPVTAAEFAVMRTAFSFALPHIMGWDQYTNPALNGTPDKGYKEEPQYTNPALNGTPDKGYKEELQYTNPALKTPYKGYKEEPQLLDSEWDR